MLSPINK